MKIDLTEAKKMNTRIIARGELSDHAHVVVGDVDIYEMDNEIYLDVKGGAAVKHLLESAFNDGKEVWTKEHKDIPLERGTYKYIPQIEYDPYEKEIRRVLD